MSTAPLPQRAYVWQREWTPAVSAAVKQAPKELAGLVVFGAEISWHDGKPKAFRCAIDWAALRAQPKPVSIALRIDPWPGPFDSAEITQTLVSQSKALLDRMSQEHIPCQELQVDFDCAQKKLPGYTRWLKALHGAVKPARLVITALPSWLEERSLPALLDETDGWVLQVHSVKPDKAAAHVLTCDPVRAREWVALAERLHRPFEAALSTYSAQAGYSPEGKLLSVALDGIQPAWPAGTHIMQFDSDADSLASLTNEWRQSHPEALRGLLWYRLPVATDQRNWRAATFAAVVAGRAPTHHLSVQTEGEMPLDFSVLNDGEADEDLAKVLIRLTWQGPPPVASEALPGWTLRSENGALNFTFNSSQRLPPGTRRSLGWLRFEQPQKVQAEVLSRP